MKHITLLTLLLACTLSLAAQSKFQFGTAYFPNYSWELDPFIDGYEPKLSHTAGLTVDYRLNENWLIGSGLGYANFGMKYQEDASELRWGLQHDGEGNFGPALPSGEGHIEELEFKNNYHFVEVPVRLTFHTNGDGLRFYASAGLAPRVFVADRRSVRAEYGDGAVQESSNSDATYNYNRIQLSTFTACGIELNLGEKAALYAGPRIQVHRLAGENVVTNDSFNADYMQLGLEMGVRVQ